MSDDIQSLISQLTTYRQTLDICLKQLAAHTPASAPPILFHQIDQARKEIALLKQDLAAAGMPIADVLIDTPTPEEEIKRKAVGETQSITGDNNIQAINSQVHVTNLTGDQVGGDKVTGDKVMGDKNIYLSQESDSLPLINPEEAQARLQTLPEDSVPDLATLPPGSRMPLTSNPLFTGREADLKQLAHTLKEQCTSVIAGIGGAGKTSLAVEFVHRYGQFFGGGVFWLNFAIPEGIPAEVATCGGAGGMRLPSFATLGLADQVQRVLAEWAMDLPRLLIFDNCEDPELVRQYRPSTGACRVLITSRDQTWEATLVDHVLPLGMLAAEESVALLRRFRPGLSNEEAMQVAEAMGHLPLGLHLTGSFLKRYARVSVAEYLAELGKVSLNHPALEGRGIQDKPIEREMNLARAFATSYEQLDAQQTVDQLAIALLARAARFAPGQPIPCEMLLESLPISEDNQFTTYDRDDALERLLSLGLLESEDDAVRLHRLIATFVLATTKDDQAQGAVEQVMIDTAARLNEVGTPAPLVTLQAHLRHITDAAKGRDDQKVARLCNALAYYLDSIADYEAARPYYERALSITEQVLGPMHPDTATSLNNLALLLKSQGAYEAARPLLERAFSIREQVLGPMHPDTALSLNNLATLRDSQGAYEAARPLYERALAIYEQMLGPMHPDTALSLNNLAVLLDSQGSYEAARPLLERALSIREQVLGPMHPDTATSLNNLAELLRSQGSYEAAQPLYERALAIYEQVLGPMHPDTATSLNNLAVLLDSQGVYEAARPLYERALSIREKVLGSMHLDTVQSLNNLAALLDSQGSYEAAQPLYERALSIREKVLGPMHPDTASSLNNLAALLNNQGSYEAARPLYERALSIREQVLGPMHPDTALSLNNLAGLFDSQGSYEAARPLYERALAINEQVQGPMHPDTALSLNNLAVLYYYQERFEEAASLMRRALVIRESDLGTEHPDTISSRQSLAAIEQRLQGNAP